MTNRDIAELLGAMFASGVIVLLALRIGFWWGQRTPIPAEKTRLGRKVGELEASLSVAKGNARAAQGRATRLDGDLRAALATAENAKELSARRRGRIEFLEEENARLEHQNAEYEKALRGVEELKSAVGRAQATPHLGAEAEQFLANVREGGL